MANTIKASNSYFSSRHSHNIISWLIFTKIQQTWTNKITLLCITKKPRWRNFKIIFLKGIIPRLDSHKQILAVLCNNLQSKRGNRKIKEKARQSQSHKPQLKDYFVILWWLKRREWQVRIRVLIWARITYLWKKAVLLLVTATVAVGVRIGKWWTHTVATLKSTDISSYQRQLWRKEDLLGRKLIPMRTVWVNLRKINSIEMSLKTDRYPYNFDTNEYKKR